MAKKWCRARACALNCRDEMEVLRLAHSLMEFTGDEAGRVVTQAANTQQPLLFTYMSDGWASKVFRRDVIVDRATGSHSVRVARKKQQFALQRALFQNGSRRRFHLFNYDVCGTEAHGPRRTGIELFHLPE